MCVFYCCCYCYHYLLELDPVVVNERLGDVEVQAVLLFLQLHGDALHASLFVFLSYPSQWMC